jgi:hypothetical protein
MELEGFFFRFHTSPPADERKVFKLRYIRQEEAIMAPDTDFVWYYASSFVSLYTDWERMPHS